MKNNEGQVRKETSTLDGVVCVSAGRTKSPVYKRVYDAASDTNVVKKVDEFDIYEFIQASKSSTDLALLQKQYEALGEVPGLEIGWDEAPDQTIMPSNIHEVYELTNNVDKAFKKLPESVQAIFGDKDKYLASLLDGSYMNIINAALVQAQNVPADTNKPANGEVNTNE